MRYFGSQSFRANTSPTKHRHGVMTLCTPLLMSTFLLWPRLLLRPHSTYLLNAPPRSRLIERMSAMSGYLPLLPSVSVHVQLYTIRVISRAVRIYHPEECMR